MTMLASTRGNRSTDRAYRAQMLNEQMAKRLRRLRLEKGLTVKALYQKCGHPTSALVLAAEDARSTSMLFWVEVCAAMGVTMADLLP